MTPFSIRRAIVAGYIIALAIISFFALYTYFIMQKGEANYRRQDETLRSLRIIESIFDDVQNIESGQRGYIISGEKSFLESYYVGLANIKKDSLALLQLKTSEKRKTDIAHLLNFIHQKIQFAEITIQLRTDEGLEVAGKSVQSDKGRVLMNNISLVVHKIEEEERAILNKFNSDRNRIARQTTTLFFILAFLFFLFLLSFFFFVRRDVKDRLNSELKSRVNEKTDAFKNILDRISDGFVAMDKEWRYVYINNSAAAISGKKAEELLNKPVWNLFPEAVDKEFYQACHRAMEKQEYTFLEVYHPGFDTWFENHIYPSPAGLSIHFRDITGKKKTELKLAETSEKLNLVAKATNDILWEADLAKQTVWWNDNFYEKFGYDKNEIEKTGKSWENYLHLDDKERVLREVSAIIEDKTQITWSDEYRFRKADGTYLNVYDRCYILRDATGKASKLIGSMADLTFLFETKKELQRTEERYKSLVDSIDSIVWEATPDTFQFSFVSKQAERLLGYPIDQWTSVPDFWEDHIHPDDKAGVMNYFIENTRKMQPYELEYRMIAADGRVMWLRDIVSVAIENDKPALLRGLMVDITSNKEAEHALRNSEDKYRTLVEQATDGIFIADSTGNFIIVNSSGCRMSQYTEKELKSMTIYDLTDPEDLKNNPFHFHEMSGERGARAERKMRRKDGTVVDTEVNAKFLPDGRFLAFIRDITERKKAVEELRASEENRRLIMDAALDAIICVDTSGTITVWSTQAVNIFGWQKEEMIGKRLSETIIPPRYRAMHEAGMKKYRDLGEGPILNKLVEITALNNKGIEFPVELSIVPVKQGNTEFFCAFVRDITARKQVEQKLIQSNERFELIARATHDAIWEWNLETAELWANEVHQQLYGLTKADPVPSVDEWMRRIHPEDRDKIVSAQEMALLSDQNYWESEYRFQNRDGNYVILFDRAYIIRNEEGKPIHLTGSMIDISERKRTEMEIIKARDMADKLIDSLPGVFYFFDKDGKFIRWN
ncbi:MAG TPA: PAS domain S-box protein, partial [Chitinophagaceae bacterium]